MVLSLEDGEKRLKAALDLAEAALRGREPGDEVPDNVFTSGVSPLPDETTDASRRSMLRALGVIEVGRGRGPRIRHAASERKKQILSAAGAVWKKRRRRWTRDE